MRLCRFNDHRIGLVHDDHVVDITPLATPLMAGRADRWPADPLICALPELCALPAPDLAGCARHRLDAVQLLAPVPMPGKIIAAPVNYAAHIAEMQANNVSPGFNLTDITQAGLFLKAPSSLIGPGQAVARRFPDRRTDYEVELVAVIGRRASCVDARSALRHVAGYAIGLDMTVRGPEERSFRKSIDTYTVLGPWLTLAEHVPAPNDLRLSLRQNGLVRQDSSTADQVMGVAELVAFASRFYTLHPGDLLFTGTPQGVGAVQAGDELLASCDRLGQMRVRIADHDPGSGT